MALIRRVVTWDEVLRAVDYLAKQITPFLAEVDSLYAVARGGLVLTGCLAHRLPWVPPIRVIELRSYVGPFEIDEKTKPTLTFVRGVDRRPLIVDDIRDSGRTLDLISSSCDFELMMVVVMFVRGSPEIFDKGIFCAWEKVDENEWVVFPWEVSDTS